MRTLTFIRRRPRMCVSFKRFLQFVPCASHMASEDNKPPKKKVCFEKAAVQCTCVFAMCVCVRARACVCLLYTSPSPRDVHKSRMPSSA